MTATTTDREQAQAQVRMAASGGRVRAEASLVRAVITAYEAAGVTGVFGPSRAALGRAEALDEALSARRDAAVELERDLSDRLADGTLDVEAVALELAGGAVPRLGEVVERASNRVRSKLSHTAATDAHGALEVVRDLLAPAVDEALEAGRKVVDVGEVVRRLKGAMWRQTVPALLDKAPTHPEWPRAVSASDRVAGLAHLASMLGRIGGPRVAQWLPGRPVGAAEQVGEVVPAPLQLAVGEELWGRPGLYAVPERGPVPPGDGGAAARLAQVRQAPVVGALRAGIDRLSSIRS